MTEECLKEWYIVNGKLTEIKIKVCSECKKPSSNMFVCLYCNKSVCKEHKNPQFHKCKV